MDNKKEIKWLEDTLENADFLYYNFDSSDYTDAEYDALENRLFVLDPSNKRFKDGKRNIVGAKLPKTKNDDWEKVLHTYKMGSQVKITDFSGLEKWYNDLVGDIPRLIVQDKLDGISIRLEYKNGKLVEAVTRGDGITGINILRNVLKMDGVPHTIKCDKNVSVRGEIILFKSNFHKFDGAKTLRNCTAGTAKRLDGVGSEWLNIKVYDVQNWKEFGFSKVSSSLEFLEDLGFDVVNYKIVKTIEEVETVFKNYNDTIRDSLNWDIDGLVIKAGLFADDDWAAPKRTIAYKFPSKRAVTKLLDVIWQDSGGRISPVALLEPVIIDGVTISRATLNNIEHIKKLNVKIGDIVEISRRNDVIPCIEKVTLPDINGKCIIPPSHDDEWFPIVHETNASGEQLVYLISTNPNSRSKRVRRILKWFTAHDTKGIASATIESLIDAKIAVDLPDFYDICINGHDKLMLLDGFGKGMFRILKQAGLKTSNTDVVTFLSGMDLNGIGTKIIETICTEHGKELSLDDFIHLTQNTQWLSNISGIGLTTAKHLQNELNKKQTIITEMKTRIVIENWKPVQAKSTKVNGLTFCFTGKMNHGRKELEDAVRANGGIISGVNKSLNYLVTNDPHSGSSKNKKVDSYNTDGGNIIRISEQDLINMIGGIN